MNKELTESSRRSEPARTSRLLIKKFLQYLLPSILVTAASSLYDVLDSLIASRLLGSDSMVIIKMGSPLVLLAAAVFVLLGWGGATLYSISLGNKDHDTAGKALTASMTAAVVIGVLFLIIGRLFFGPLTNLLCQNPELEETFRIYLSVELLYIPVMIVVQTLTEYLPAAGAPMLATAVSIVCNAVNLVMDYVLIRFFHMGVEGTAWATLIGLLCGGILLAAAFLMKKVQMYSCKSISRALSALKDVGKKGSPDALTQLGFSLKFGVSNSLAMAYAGTAGMVGYSLCIQAISIVSIFLAALINAAAPIMGVLHGERDYKGESAVLKTVLVLQLGLAVLCTVFFELCAPWFAGVFNITDPAQLTMAVHALRIFSLSYIARNVSVFYFRYLNVIGLETYAAIVSALDGFALIVPMMILMCRIFGIEGLWWAYPLASALLLLFIILCNRMIRKRSPEKYQGLLLLENDAGAEPVLDVTISKDNASISGISEKLQEACQRIGVDRGTAVKAALIVEEMAVYAANNKRQDSYMDVLVRLYNGNIEIDFRSLGPVFDPLKDNLGDFEENIKILRGVSESIENEYVMGMNCTRLTIKGK